MSDARHKDRANAPVEKPILQRPDVVNLRQNNQAIRDFGQRTPMKKKNSNYSGGCGWHVANHLIFLA
jgi:hypothetical protein